MADDSSEIVKEQSESVSATNLKALGDAPAFFQNQMYAQAVSNSAGWVTINQAIVGKIAESIIATDPREGGVDVAGLQALSKIVGNIPPVTP